MGIFNRKKKEVSSQERLDQIIQELKIIIEKDDSFSIMLLVGSRKTGSSLINGNALDIREMITETAKKDLGVKELILSSAKELSDEDLDFGQEKIKQNIQDTIKNMDGISKPINFPDGTKGLIIDASNIEKMTDDYVDKIIEDMLKNMPPSDES